MIKVNIDGVDIEVEKNTTVLQAARKANIDIPTLCFLKEISANGDCRMCVVEIEGRRGLSPSCITIVEDGMVIKTNTPKINEARRVILDLILSSHNRTCLTCVRNGNCELQTLAEKFGITNIEYEGEEVELNHSNYIKFLGNKNQDFRKKVFEQYYKYFINRKNTIASLYKGKIKESYFSSKVRKFNSSLEKSLYSDNIDIIFAIEKYFVAKDVEVKIVSYDYDMSEFDLVALSGYENSTIINHSTILNVYPTLLPAFRGEDNPILTSYFSASERISFIVFKNIVNDNIICICNSCNTI